MQRWNVFMCLALLGLTTNMALGQDESLRFVRIIDQNNPMYIDLIADAGATLGGARDYKWAYERDTHLPAASLTVMDSNANNSVYGKMDIITAAVPSPQPIAGVSSIYNSNWDVDADTFGALLLDGETYSWREEKWWVDSIDNHVPAETEVPVLGTVTLASVGGFAGDPPGIVVQQGEWQLQYKGKKILEVELMSSTLTVSTLTVRHYDANGNLADEFDVPWDWESGEADIPFTFMAEVADAPPTGEFITLTFDSRVAIAGQGSAYPYPYTSTGGNIFESAVHMEFAPTP